MYTDERSLKVHFFVDRAWTHNAAKVATCRQKIQHATKVMNVEFNLGTINKEEVWVAYIKTNDLPSSLGTVRYWYISLDDCSLESSFHSPKDVPEMEYQYTIKSGDGKGPLSHFSADQNGMNTLHVVQILTSSALLFCIAYKLIKAMTSSQGQVHVALLAVGCALTLDILSNLSEVIHALWYTVNGIGFYTFDCLASHFEAQCDALIALVLILVGSGWTLPSDVIVQGGGGNQNLSMLGSTSVMQRLVIGLQSPSFALQQVMDGNPASILLFSILILHALLAQWGRTYDEEFDSFHALDHTAGKAVIVLRVILSLVFLTGAASVRNSGRCPTSLYPFLKKFQFVGLTWFISLPFVSMIASAPIPDHKKHLVLAVGSAMVQSSSLASLVWLFCADASASPYHRVTTVSKANTSLSNVGQSSSGGGGGGYSSGGRIFKLGKTKIALD
jgi:hypothetical protein